MRGLSQLMISPVTRSLSVQSLKLTTAEEGPSVGGRTNMVAASLCQPQVQTSLKRSFIFWPLVIQACLPLPISVKLGA